MQKKTFKQAQKIILDHFEAKGFEVKRNLKFPWAKSRIFDDKYYLKPQALYKTNKTGNITSARSICSDIRDLKIVTKAKI